MRASTWVGKGRAVLFPSSDSRRTEKYCFRPTETIAAVPRVLRVADRVADKLDSCEIFRTLTTVTTSQTYVSPERYSDLNCKNKIENKILEKFRKIYSQNCTLSRRNQLHISEKMNFRVFFSQCRCEFFQLNHDHDHNVTCISYDSSGKVRSDSEFRLGVSPRESSLTSRLLIRARMLQ